MRIFISVPIPDELKEKLTKAQSELKRVPADIKWTREDQFHLTLKFLGEVPDQEVSRLGDSLKRSMASERRFPVTVGGIGAFPSINRPRVIWTGMSAGSEELARLAASVDTACGVLGFPLEKRPFSGHLTLGRLRSFENISGLAKRLRARETETFGSFTVGRVHIMQSVLLREGARHTCLQSIELL